MDLDRRQFAIGLVATAAAGVAGAAAVATGVVDLPGPIRNLGADTGPAGTIPDAPEGEISLTSRHSTARGTDVGFFTAVPAGSGDGKGLPVCLILHGASATTANYRDFGLPRFLSAAVESGVPPFVLAGVDGGVKSWRTENDDDPDDPQRMLLEEVPGWLTEAGFDADRLAAWGWSMGGHGSLLLAEAAPGRLKAVAAFSPAVPDKASGLPDTADGRPRDVWSAVDRLDGQHVGLWCGTSDALYDNVRAFAQKVPKGPAIAEWGKGAHTRRYWDRVTPDAFRFLGRQLDG